VNSLSPAAPARQQFELWIFTPGGRNEPLSDCGLFDSRGAAEQAASAVRDWFHLGVWPAVLDRVNPDAQDEFFFLRKGLVVGGSDTAAVCVEVREWKTHNDNRDSDRPADWLVPELRDEIHDQVEFFYRRDDAT
jgi:hypothetical protein